MKRRDVDSLARRAVEAVCSSHVAASYALPGPPGSGPVELMVVVDKPEDALTRRRLSIDGEDFAITIVSTSLLEKDAQRGTLGEFVASSLLAPYQAISGQELLRAREVDLKTRIVKEELQNLYFRYHDLTPEILIDPPFFFHARMQRRIRIFPPSKSVYQRLPSQSSGDPSYGFGQALGQMASAGLITIDGSVKVTPKFLERVVRPRQMPITPLREIELAVRRLAAQGIAHSLLDPYLVQEISRGLESSNADSDQRMVDPKSFLHLHTESGLVSLDDQRSYMELIGSKEGGSSLRSMRRIGGALNYVYLLDYVEDHQLRRAVAKTYQNWFGLKWIPLSIWTIGSQNFDVLGDRRLANEYRMNRLLRSKGHNAPDIHHVSLPRRTIIEEFIEGTSFDRIIKECLSHPDRRHLQSIQTLGEEICRLHLDGLTLGDSKPDNAIMDDEGRVWFVDLEQASDKGNPAWDLAELLFYSGHYTLRWSRMKALVDSFLRGYMRSGDSRVLKEITRAKYKRVFGIMTAPHIIMGISRLCGSYGSSP